MTDHHFLVKTNTHDYNMTVRTTISPLTDLPTNRTFYFGGKKRGCVTILITPLIEDTRNDTDPSIAIIDSVIHSPLYNVKGDMLKGKGTKHMMLSSIRTMHRLFKRDAPILRQPRIRLYGFTDASAVECFPNGTKISLSYLSLAIHGKSWYERYFHAYIYDETVREKYRADVRSYLAKEPFPFASFYDTFLSQSDADIPRIKNLYEASKSCSAFCASSAFSIGSIVLPVAASIKVAVQTSSAALLLKPPPSGTLDRNATSSAGIISPRCWNPASTPRM